MEKSETMQLCYLLPLAAGSFPGFLGEAEYWAFSAPAALHIILSVLATAAEVKSCWILPSTELLFFFLVLNIPFSYKQTNKIFNIRSLLFLNLLFLPSIPDKVFDYFLHKHYLSSYFSLTSNYISFHSRCLFTLMFSLTYLTCGWAVLPCKMQITSHKLTSA